MFRNPDGTVAILYHRPAGPDNELQEIVMIHSHDGGRGWDGELVVGREATDATYSGVTDSEGNLYVVYGRNATGASGGGIKLRSLFYQGELHTWRAGQEHVIVWDWPGRGARAPVLAFTGDRLWLVYRYYDGSRHVIIAQYADPDTDGEYSASQWSEPFSVFERVREANASAGLVSHGTRLSALYADPDIGVSWRLLPDPQSESPQWTLPGTVFLPPNGAQEIRFSAVAGRDDEIHLNVSVDPGFIGYVAYDGTNWSRPKQLAARDVRGPSIASDGRDVWAFWMRDQESGRSQVEFRRLTEGRGWSQAALKLWAAGTEEPLPFLLLYRDGNRSYTDVTRYAATLGGVDGGQANIARFLEHPGDLLYLGNLERIDYGALISAEENGKGPSLALEYWNGSTWAPLPMDSSPSGEIDDSDALSTSGDFSQPEDWQPTDIDGAEGYYLRLRKSTFPVASATALKISLPHQMSGLVVAAEPNRTMDMLWYERSSSSGPARLWYGAISSEVVQPTNAEAVPDPLHDIYDPQPAREVGFAQRQMSPLPLPPGPPRQFVFAELDRGERYEYQLLDGQVRYVEVLSTRRVFRTESNVTVWATATIEVSGPGVEPQREEIPAAFFQAPVVLNDVRVYVVITREFDDLRLDGGATSRAARLMLSDARYSLTDLGQYRWPFPGVIWGLRPFQNYYQGLQGSIEKHSHSGALTQGMPPGMPIQAWARGTYTPRRVDDGWSASLTEADDGVAEEWHRVSPLEGVEWERRGKRVELGDELSEISGDLTWGGPGTYEWAPLLAEWYMAGSTPIERSYVKDWLVLGPYGDQEELAVGDVGTFESRESLLEERFLPDEETVTPQEGDVAAEGLAWQRFDGIVPGVVDVAEAVSGYPNSGWARLNNNYPFSVAYFATYVYTPRFQQVVLNIGSSDEVKVWVRDNVVLERDAMVRMRRTSDWTIVPDFYRVPVGLIPVGLEPGWTRILVKLSQGKTSFTGFQSAQRAWQFSFRVSDEAGQPVYDLRISPERDRFADPLGRYALLASDVSRADRAEPPIARHEWPERVDLAVSESFIYTLVDGTQRELTLLNYEIVYADGEVVPGTAPQHVRIDAEVQVRDLETGTIARTTINVALGAVPVSVNGLRLLGSSVDLALPFENVADQGPFPLAEGKNVGFAVNDANFTLFPDMDNYAFPYEIAFGEIPTLHAWLQYQGLRRGQAHAGYDLGGLPCNVPVKAIVDGFVTFKWYADQGAVFINPNGARTTPGWHMTHVKQGGNLVPNGSWVKKGTPLATAAPGCEFDLRGSFHNGSRGSYDFNPMRFQAEIWQYEHSTDFPSPRFWLALSPFTGDMASSYMFSDESGDIPEALQPREADYDKDGEKRWRFYDNYVNSVVRMGEASSPYPFASYDNQFRNSVGYMATYIYSSQDHTNDDEVRLRWGMSYGGKIWLNGKTVFEGVEDRYNTYDRPRERLLVIDKYDIVLPLKQG